MKKILKYIITFIFIIILIPRANAFQIGEEFTVTTDSGHNSTDTGFPGLYSISKATQKSTSKDFEAFCIDRGKHGGGNYVVGRLLPENSTKKYDYAALYIVKETSCSYEVRHYALRFLTDVIAGYDQTWDTNFLNIEKAAVNAFINNDSNFRNVYKEFGGKKINGASSYTGNINSLNNVKELLIKAMEFSISKSEEELKETKISKGETGEVSKESSSGTVTYKKIVSAKIDIYNIMNPESDDEYFKIISEPEIEAYSDQVEVKMLGVSETFNDSEDGWDSISVGEDISKKLEDRKGTLYLGFLVTLTTEEQSESAEEEEEEDCQVSIKIEYEYTNSFAGARINIKGIATSGAQRFIIADVDPIKGEFTLETNLCSEATCDPTISVPTLCEPGEDEKVNEDGLIEYEFREAYNPDTGKYNIKKCLLKKNSNDIAENSYKYIDSDNAEMVADNPYCEVKCKEDYKFGVPYKKTTEAGRYFQISTSIKGEQDCYTTKLDYTKYSEDIVKKQAEIIDKYNKWLENYENHKKLNWEKDSDMTCSYDSCTKNSDGSCDSQEKDMGDFYHVVHSDKFLDYKISEGDIWTISVNSTGKDPEIFGKFKNDATCDSNCSKSKEECKVEKTAQKDWEDRDEKEFKPNIQSAKQELKQLLEELRMIVDEYNSCVADHDYASKQEDKSKTYGDSAFWDMVYIYDPEVYYSYDEPEPNNTSISKWIEEVKSISSCDNGTCDIMISPDELIKAEKCSDKCSVDCEELGHSGNVEDIDENMHPVTWYCDGEVDNEYKECKGNEINNILSVGDYNEEYHWMVLDEDLDTGIEAEVHIGNNLKNSKHLITKMDYLHKIAQSEGNYTTARVYFSGHDNGDIKIENTDKIENYDVVDGLPVSINTPQGVYNYTLTLKNMGTYYSTTPNLGRIFDDEGNTMSNLYIEKGIRPSATKENGEEIKGNEYVCTYEVSANECTDSSGTKHYKTECNLENETWDQCKERLCPNSAGPYCVHDSNGYYVCDNNYYNESCQKQGSREEALAAVGCTLGEPCEKNYNCCPDCTVECIGECVVKSECTSTDCTGNPNSKPQYNFKPISPGNMFPTDREIGFNWDISGKYKNSLVARKAKDTREEITTRANDVTSESGSSGIPKVEDYSLKVTMDTNMINKIREYNQEQGTYNNDTMSCYDYKLDYDEDHCKKNGYAYVNNECIMSNIFCYSEFVDDLLDGDFGGEVDMTNKEGRTKTKEAFNKQYTGITGTLDNVVTNDYWTIYSFTSLDTNGDSIPDIGPSWK